MQALVKFVKKRHPESYDTILSIVVMYVGVLVVAGIVSCFL